MSRWTRRPRNPLGTLPKGVVTKAGIVGGAIVMALVIITSPASDEEGAAQDAGAGEQGEEGAREQAATGETLVASTAAAIDRLKDQAERLREAREREEELRGQAVAAQSGYPPAGRGSGPSAEPETSEEQLREELRLADIRRSHEALRSPVVALSSRAAEEGAPPPGTASPEDPSPKEAAVPGGSRSSATAAERAELQDLVRTADVGEPADASPTPTTRPDEPAGWERIFEGQVLEAVLATELRGDFAGPAVAIVSAPLWSRDRQRILVPRGTRAIGRATAVGDWQQARLAVSFHRLVFPDGTYIRLEFSGLDQAGATGLKDRINRHYLSTIGAAGAVGLVSGLTLRGSQPYQGGIQGGRAGAGIGMGRGAEQILERYLNRLPTVTIRAGTRLRLIFTSDALVPRPAFRLQRNSRRTP